MAVIDSMFIHCCIDIDIHRERELRWIIGFLSDTEPEAGNPREAGDVLKCFLTAGTYFVLQKSKWA